MIKDHHLHFLDQDWRKITTSDRLNSIITTKIQETLGEESGSFTFEPYRARRPAILVAGLNYIQVWLLIRLNKPMLEGEAVKWAVRFEQKPWFCPAIDSTVTHESDYAIFPALLCLRADEILEHGSPSGYRDAGPQ